MKQRQLLCAALLGALCGCTENQGTQPPLGPLQGTLAVDIRDQAAVEITGNDPQKLMISVTLTKGFGVAPEGQKLQAEGRAELFPEARMTLYTARFAANTVSDGRCGGEPISLALSLHQRETARVSGSLSAYCGAGVYTGEPTKILRLSGEMRRSAQAP